MKKIALIIAMMLVSPFAVYAAQENKTAIEAEKMTGDIVHVGVNGMVCDFCAQSLKKVFLKEASVSTVDISLEDKMITLGLKKGKTIDDATIKKLVDYAGYEVSEIHHTSNPKK